MKRLGARLLLAGGVAILLLTAEACAGASTTMSVGVGVGFPAPWGGVTIGAAVPMGYGW